MANVDSPWGGARAVKHANGGRILANAYMAGEEVFKGDWLKKVNDGDVAQGTANTDVMGVCALYASGDEVQTHVYEDPYIVFMCQASGVVAQIDQNSSADIKVTHAGVAPLSGMEVDATAGAGLGEQLIIIDKVDRPDNAWGANVDLLVVIYEHQMVPGVQTAGGI